MLLRTDPFRELDRLSQQVFGNPGTLARPSAMPIDAWQEEHQFIVEFDLPGVDPDSIDLDIERNVLTVRAERKPGPKGRELLMAERPVGVFSRQLILGDALDVERVQASYDGGVLTLRIPKVEKAKPRRIKIDRPGDRDRELTEPAEPTHQDRQLSSA